MEDFVDHRALVVYPDAIGGAWSLGGDRDTDFVEKLVKAVGQTYCIDYARVLAFGFSFGAKFVHHLGCTRTNLVKAIAGGDGSFGGRASSCGLLPVLVTHRPHDDDELLSWGKGAVDTWVAAAGCSKVPEPLDAAHGCPRERDLLRGHVLRPRVEGRVEPHRARRVPLAHVDLVRCTSLTSASENGRAASAEFR
jgi:poly(3-hydroxybutyrate) depolymerase